MITSAQNVKIKLARALLSQKKERVAANKFVVEGIRLAEEAVESGMKPELVLFSRALSGRGRELITRLESTSSQFEEVEANLLDRVSDTRSSQGILMILETPDMELPGNPDPVLALDDIRDPGNLGTILRSAWAAGFRAALLTPQCVEAFSPKVVRAGMGAHFNVPIRTLDPAEIQAFCKEQAKPPLQILLADARNGQPCWEADLTVPLCLVIGSEAEGASERMQEISDRNIFIPIQGDAESFNAAAAAGILMYEITRQRTTK